MNSAETLKKAYVALKQTKERLAQLEAERHEPLAVIGMGCRFPGGADDPQKFWSLIKEGKDGTSEIPADRWPVATYFDADTEQPGKMYVQRAGFLTGDVYRFDAAFFGLTPKEVLAMDPQQRLLLEVSWQAMENAGLDVTALRGSQTGVFIGVSSFDYATAHIHSGQFDKIDAYSVTGISFSTAAGRISYLFGFEGPSLAVDTACSSSLVALHLACQSLRRGESRMALVGGVNLMLNPEIHIGFCKLRGISPDGRCKSFDAAADGHGRGEGCGVVLLKRLSDAQADGDNILAVIRGSAVNQDGRSNGMTAPNGEAQRKVILAALENAAMKPEEISFIEAHGTGTPLGDPIEMDALSRTYGPHKTAANPLVVSSVKANIGHLEASAGVAGIIKSVLILQHGQVPPQALFQNPNPHIDWNDWPVLVPKQTVTFSKKETTLAGAVSAFGFGGTNAHVILTSHATEGTTASAQRSVQLLTLSAKLEATLPKLAEVYADYLTANASLDLGSICHTAQTGRSVFPHRLAITGRTHAELTESLKLVTRGESNPFISRHTVAARANNRVTFIFTGQGSQYLNMGRDLYESEPVFRATLQQCDEWLQANAGLSVVKLMYDANATEDALHQTIHTQPVIFCIGYALAQMWQSWGIKPAAVLGHSIGELTAACVAGVFTWQEALRLVTTRGRLIQSLPLNGAMGAIIASEARVREVIAGMDNVSIAAVNAPENTVIAGDKDAIETVLNLFKAQNIPAQKLRISHALHSPLMEPVLAAFEREATAIHYQRPKIPVGSNVTGGLVTDEIASAKYWWRQLREPVRFLEAIRQLHTQGHDLFLELGGTSTLNSLGMQCLSGKACGWVASLGANNSMFNMRPRRSAKDNDWEPISRAAGELFVRGVSVDWKAFHGGASFAKAVLPNYPFEGQTFRMETLHAKGEPVPCRVPASTVVANTAATSAIVPVVEVQASQTLDAKAVGERLNQLIRHISGIEPARLNLNSSWLELGLDSLMITRLRESVLQEFQVDLELSAFFVLVDSPEKLAAHVAQAMPVGLSLATAAAPVNMKAVASVAAASPNIGEVVKPLPGESLESLFARQMEAMRQMFEQQMALLRSVAQANASAASPAVVKQVPQANFRSVKFDDDSLTATQRKFLDQFIARYTQRTAKSKAFAQKNRVRFADWINSLGFRKTLKELVYPIVSARSEGSRIWDIDGNEYIDLAIGYGVSFFGNRFAPVVKAVQEQLALGYELGPQNALAGEVATLVAELTGVERVTFANTGSEAVMVALRVARTVTKRSKIVLFAGSYHGISDGVLAQPIEGGFSAPTAPGIPPEMVSQVMVLNYGTSESLEIIRKHAYELAAVLVEPVQSRRPGFQPREFLHELRQLTQESGTVLIFDEMITGFRIHPGGAQAWFGVQADLVTYGKIPGGGLPIGIVSGKAQFMDAVDGGAWNFGDDSHPAKDMTFFAGTFCKHPLTMAAAKAILTHIRDHGDAPYADLRERSARFAERMNQFFISEKIPFEIVHFGPLFRFESRGKFHVILQPLEMDLMFQLLLEKGIYTWERRICCWSMAHTQADMDQVAQAIIETIRELRTGGFAIEESIIQAPAKKEAAKADLIPAASPQRRIYVLDQMEDPANDPQSYQMTSGLWISGNLDTTKLENNLRQLLQRHEALRTSFELKDGELYQRIHPQVNFALEQKPAQSLSAEAWFKEFSQRFDLGKAPLFRAWLIQFENGKKLLLLASHHAVIDGLSWNRFVQEFLALYRGEVLSPVVRQYRDFCDWSAKHVTANSKSEQYWLKQFAGEIPVLDLPTDFSRSVQRSTQGDVVHFEVSREVVERLKQAARQTNSTLFMVLLAAYQTLLHRLTNQTDLVVGTPAAGRPSSEFAEVVGMFANTLPLRSQIYADKSLREFIAQVKQRVVEAFDHQDFAIDQLINKLNLARDTSRNALFDTIMVFEKGDDRVFQLPGLSIEPYRTPKAGNIADLCAEIVEQNGGLKIAFEFGTRLFKRATIERWVSYFQTLLTHLPDALDQSPSVIDILPPTEKRLLLDEWSRSKDLTYDSNQTVLDLLSKHAKASPDKLAVACGKDCLTRAELDRLATRIAQTLLSRGMGEARRVGVCGVRSVETIAGMVGVMKAGGAFVPLDPEYPVERLKTILQDAGVKLLLTQRELGDRFRDLGVELVFLDDLGNARSQPLPKVVPTDSAYCIYTSGSTGRPKGVLINHANLLYSNLARLEFYGHAAVESLLCVPSLAFDMAMASVIWPLCDGGLLVLPEEGKQRDVWYLSELIKRHRISHWLSVPSLYRLLLNETPVARLEPLKCVVVAGETCSVDLLRAHREKLPQTPVFNEFGPAEGTVWCSVERVDHLDYAQIPSVPIGQPIAGTRIFLLNERQQPVPIGVIGELCFAGPGVAQGYLNHPEMTAERFLASSLSSRSLGRIYRSGDFARYSESGRLEFIGRREGLVKVRGHRVELEEVEAVLRGLPGVREAAVGIITNDTGEAENLVAYLVMAETIADAADLKVRLATQLQSQLPAYMIPYEWMFLEGLPFNTNGKVDRKRLPRPAKEKVTTAREFIAPRNEAEQTLVDVWREVLQVERVGVTDDYLELGGDSIKAIQIAARLRQKHFQLSVPDVFRFPTIAQLATRVQREAVMEISTEATGEFPLSPIQHWFFDGFADASVNHFNQSILLEATGRLDESAIQKALGHLVAHHDMLRATFPDKDGQRIQHVAEKLTVRVCEIVDLTRETEAEATLRQHGAQAQATLNIATGPLWRVVIYRLIGGDKVLFITHHLIVDMLSWATLTEDFAACYQAALANREPVLLPKTQPYRAWASEWSKLTATARIENADILAKYSANRPASDFPISVERSYPVQSAKSITLALSTEQTNAILQDANRAFNTRPMELALSALAVALRQWIGKPQMAIWLEGHGRSETALSKLDVSRTVGWFTSFYPLAIDLPDDNDPAKQIVVVKESARKAAESGTSFGVQRYLARDSALATIKPFISFNFLGEAATPQLPTPFVRASEFRDAQMDAAAPRPVPVDCEVLVVDGCLQCRVTYNGGEFREETIQQFLENWRRALEQVIHFTAQRQSGAATPSDYTFKEMSVQQWEELLDDA